MANNNQIQTLPLLPYLCSAPTILGLVLIGELLALALVLADATDTFSWLRLGSVSMVTQWIALSSAMTLCQLGPLINRLPSLLSGCLAYSICLLIAAIILWIAQLTTLMPFNFWLWGKSMLIAAIFSGTLLRYLYLQQQLNNQQHAESQARIESLQARIRPHFLFNSMNTIASLIPVNPKAAEKTVEDLSDLFRSSLQTPGSVRLSTEISLCKSYIAIEKIRLGDRLTMTWTYEEPLPDILVPSLCLQPLLENAINHGIQHLINGGNIQLTIETLNEYLFIRINNPIPESGSPIDNSHQGNQIALNNIKHRLQLYYGKHASLSTHEDKEKNQYLASIKLPLSKKMLIDTD